MQIKAAALVLALAGSSVLGAPTVSARHSLSARSALAEVKSVMGRQFPDPDPVRCKQLEETCDCSRIDKENNMEEYFQCTTNWQCEWCMGLWRTPKPEEEGETPDEKTLDFPEETPDDESSEESTEEGPDEKPE